MDVKKSSCSKKERRLLSKKKKAAAFLSLIGHEIKPKSSHTVNEIEDSAAMEETRETKKVAEQSASNIQEGSKTDEEVSDDVLMEMRKIIQQRKKDAMQKPKVFLTLEEMIQFRPMPEEPVRADEIPPLFVMDLQQLLLYGIQGNIASYKPRWCKLLRVGKVSSVVLLILDGLSYNDYQDNKSNFPFIMENFPNLVEMICPLQYGQRLESELYSVPLSVSQLKKVNVRVPEHIRNSVIAKIGQPVSKVEGEKFSRKCLLLSTYQMMSEGYPLPIKTNTGQYQKFVFTKDEYSKVTADSPMFALDCEMCLTALKRSELTRVSIISENGTVVYDTLVKPQNQIINYLTKYSGITKEMMEPVNTRLEDVQRDIKKILPPDAILCGQSLNGDLMALKMFHPYVIDTSVIFNTSGNRKIKAGLRKLTQFFLGRSIQGSQNGHCSAEDATATLDLVKLKLQKGLEFGDATLSGIYFPDIHTYFMGGKDGNKGAAQNVEHDVTEVASSKHPTSNKTEDRSSPTPTGTSPQKSFSSSNKLLKRDHNGVKIDSEDQQSSQSSSVHQSKDTSSSSSSSESDEEVASEPKKKKKCSSDSDISVATSESVPSKIMNSATGNSPSQENFAQVGKSEKCSKQLFGSTSEAVKQQQSFLFSQKNSVHVPHSFFKLVNEAGRSACIIDYQDIINQYAPDPIEKVIVENDTEARRNAKKMVEAKEFVWAKFRDFEDIEEVTLEKREKLMRKMDNRVRSVMKHVKPNALVAVVMTGRLADGAAHNMATFVTTT